MLAVGTITTPFGARYLATCDWPATQHISQTHADHPARLAGKRVDLCVNR